MLRKRVESKVISLVLSVAVLLMNFNIFPVKIVTSYDYLSRGIDVSAYQGTIDWRAAANDGIDFAIIRSGLGKYSFQEDSKFKANYADARNAGVKVGTYWVSYAMSADEACEEAEVCYSIINGCDFDYPVYYDMEVASQSDSLSKQQITDIGLAFCQRLSSYGYTVGIYANRNWFTNYIDKNQVINSGYEIWLAQYPSGEYAVNPEDYDKSYECGMWQYSSKGSVSGISGYVDVDVSYRDYGYKDSDVPDIIVEQTPPAISDIKIIGQTDTSYTIQCEVYDNESGIDRVQFPTWTNENGQDDLISDWGTNEAVRGAIDGNTVTYTVNISDHNNELGSYTTHIYAYDKCGNFTSSEITFNFIWYRESVPADIGDTFDAVILAKEPWIPVRAYDNDNAALHTEEGLSSEMWRFTKQSDGSYTIQNFKTGKFLDAEDTGTAGGTNVITFEGNGGENQKWFLYKLSDGYVIRPAYTDLVLDVAGAAFESGTNIQLYERNGSPAQIFSLYGDLSYGNPKINDTEISVTGTTAVMNFNGYYSDEYRIYRSTDKKTWKVIDTVDSALYSDSGLIPSTTYYYKIDFINRFYTVTSDIYSVTTEKSNKKGDINNDGSFNIADFVMLQRFILDSGTLINWENADVCEDDRIDVFDMILMRKLVVEEVVL